MIEEEWREHLEPMPPTPNIHTAPHTQLSPLVLIAGSEKQSKMEGKQWRRQSVWSQQLEETFLLLITCEQSNQNQSLSQTVGTENAPWRKRPIATAHQAMWETHWPEHSFLLWETCSLSCLTS